ncbi:fumarylacetoacetate hydrolase family protein [Fibrobacterota bacterium]
MDTMDKFSKVLYKNRQIWCRVVDNTCFELKNSIYDETVRCKETPLASKELKLLPPCDASKVIALAYNYRGLVGKQDSYDEPLVFFKSLTGLIGHNDNVIYPAFANKVWQEVELAIIIKKTCKNVSVYDAENYILGYTCGNDITSENILNRDWHLARSKGLDTFCPLGPHLVTGIDTSQLRLRSFINKRKTQDSFTSDRILNDHEAVSLVSRYVTLSPGDVILTGSPFGATDAVIVPGDTIKIDIEKIGVLTNIIRKEAS